MCVVRVIKEGLMSKFEAFCRLTGTTGNLGESRTKNLLITTKLQLLANYIMSTSKQIAHQGKLSNVFIRFIIVS